MSTFVFPTDAGTEAYCHEIANAMQLYLGITQEDAIARINEQWKHTSLLGELDLVYHEMPDYWAKWIFFGKPYWRNADEATQRSLSRIERRVNLILDHLGIEYKDVSGIVKHWVRLGRTTQAAQMLQHETGIDFRDAEATVKRLIAEQNETEQPPA